MSSQSAASLGDRLQSLSLSLRETNGLISQLSSFSSTQSPSTSSTPQERAELSEDIHLSLNELEDQLELYRQEAEVLSISKGRYGRARNNSVGARIEQSPDEEKLYISASLERLSDELKLARGQFRRAQLLAKRAEDTSAREARRQAYHSTTHDTTSRPGYARRKNQEKLTQEEAVQSASSDVTAALKRTHALLLNEVEKSAFAHETLRNSTAQLQSLQTTYTGLDDLLSNSRKLISTLMKSQKSDTWYLETAVYILVATLGWLVFRRWLYGPIRYLLWIPGRLVLGWVYGVLSIVFGMFTGGDGSAVKFRGVNSVREKADTLRVVSSGARSIVDGALPTTVLGSDGVEARPSASSGQSPDYPLSSQVGDMVEEKQSEQNDEPSGNSNEHDESRAHDEDDDEEDEDESPEEPRRDEGTVLRERRDEEPVNPKKRVWEEPPPAKTDSHHDEL